MFTKQHISIRNINNLLLTQKSLLLILILSTLNFSISSQKLNQELKFYDQLRITDTYDFKKVEAFVNDKYLNSKDMRYESFELGVFYYVNDIYDKAEWYLNLSLHGYYNITPYDYKDLTEEERNVRWKKDRVRFETFYPSYFYKTHKLVLLFPYLDFKSYPIFISDNRSTVQRISELAFDKELLSKGLLLSIVSSQNLAIFNSYNTALKTTLQELNKLKSKDIEIESSKFADSISILDKEVTFKSQFHYQNQQNYELKWQDVQKSLQPNEAAIEFVNFRYFNRELTDSMLNYALVLRKDSKYPELIPLFEDKQLDSLFVKSATDVNQLYTYRVTNLRKDSVESRLNYGSKLYNLIWKPLEASLNGIKTVYYAPSGKLNQVAFAAIPVDSTVLLSDKYKLHQVTSTRQVIKKVTATNKLQEVALFGGIQYELDNDQLAQIQNINTTTKYRSVFVSDSTQRSNTFGYLKGTYDEVKGIAKELKQKGLADQLYTGAVASEAEFKKLSGTKTDIIHIATHGFYLPVEETKREDFRLMGFDGERRNVVLKNPLLRSGLVMAGANRAWRGDSIPENWEDGILTAHEISQINLTNTELVVLSACETGLGDDGGSEGVFGLQRAFKMAGVQTIIMSLWKVDDEATSIMMQNFYNYWLAGMNKHDAFRKAQNDIRTRKDPSGKKDYSNPYYWAAFVMVD